jgi:hypothetical protein
VSYAIKTVLLAAGWHADQGQKPLAQAEVGQVLRMFHQFSASGDPAATFTVQWMAPWVIQFSKAYPGLMNGNETTLFSTGAELQDSYKLVIRAEATSYMSSLATGNLDAFFFPMPLAGHVPFLFQQNRTLKEAEDLYQRDLSISQQACGTPVTDYTEPPADYTSYGPTLKEFFTLNGIGNAYVHAMAYANQGKAERDNRCEVQDSFVTIAKNLGLQSPQY